MVLVWDLSAIMMQTLSLQPLIGLLDVKTDKFFIGTESTQFISGSDGLMKSVLQYST